MVRANEGRANLVKANLVEANVGRANVVGQQGWDQWSANGKPIVSDQGIEQFFLWLAAAVWCTLVSSITALV